MHAVTMPDGTVHNFPDEATPEMMAQALGVTHEQPYLQEAKQSIYANPGGTLQAYAANAMQGVPVIGPFLDEVGSAGAAALGYGSGAEFGDRYADLQARQAALRRAGQEQNPQSTIAGQVGAGLAGISAVPTISNLGTAGNIAANTAAGAGYGAASGFGMGSGQEDRLDKMQAGAKLGAVLGGLTSSAGEIVDAAARGARATMTGTKADAIQNALDMDIPVYKGQVTESKPAQYFTSVANELPLSGAEGRAAGQYEAFNKKIAESLGEQGATEINSELMNTAKNRIGQSFTDINSRNNLNVNNELLDALGGIQKEANTRLVGPEAGAIENIVNEVRMKSPEGVMPGESYQGLRTYLNNVTGDKAYYAKQLRRTLDDAFNQGLSGQDAAQNTLNRVQYKNLKTIEPLAETANANGGNFPMANLLGRLKATDDNLNYGSNGDLARLAQVGQLLKTKVPNSGTAQRNVFYDLMKGGAGLIGAGIAGRELGYDPVESGGGALAAALLMRGGNAALNGPVTSQWLNGNPQAAELARLLRTIPAQPAMYGGQQ